MDSTTALTWTKRPRREVNLTSERRIWASKDRRFRVVGCKSLFGLPTTYYALKAQALPWGVQWNLLSRHRKLSAAVKACEARNGRN